MRNEIVSALCLLATSALAVPVEVFSCIEPKAHCCQSITISGLGINCEPAWSKNLNSFLGGNPNVLGPQGYDPYVSICTDSLYPDEDKDPAEIPACCSSNSTTLTEDLTTFTCIEPEETLFYFDSETGDIEFVDAELDDVFYDPDEEDEYIDDDDEEYEEDRVGKIHSLAEMWHLKQTFQFPHVDGNTEVVEENVTEIDGADLVEGVNEEMVAAVIAGLRQLVEDEAFQPVEGGEAVQPSQGEETVQTTEGEGGEEVKTMPL